MTDSIAVLFSPSGAAFLTAGFLTALVATAFAVQFVQGFRKLRAGQERPRTGTAPVDFAGRYHPMLRLLADDDLEFVAGNPKLTRMLRADRRRIFRRYLACLTKDYGRLLEGIRLVMVQSSVDRPDLARALAKNRVLFALAVTRIEFRLALHAAGIGTVDISGVVEAFDRLREHAATLAPAPMAASLA